MRLKYIILYVFLLGLLCGYPCSMYGELIVTQTGMTVKPSLLYNSHFNPQKIAKDNNMSFVKVKDPFRDIIITNTIYVIDESFDLGGKELVIPQKSILYVRKGIFCNGRIVGNHTIVVAKNRVVFSPGTPKFRGYENAKGEYCFVTSNSGAIQLSGTWDNEECGAKWTGLDSVGTACSSIALNNYILLHKEGMLVIVPKGVYHVYKPITNSYHPLDFSGSQLVLQDFNEIEDRSIELPYDVHPVALKHPGDIMKIAGNAIVVKNFSIDGGSLIRDNVASGLGVEHSIRISSADSVILENITITNTIGCGVAMNKTSSNIAFRNVTWDNIGEHGIYTHSSKGNLVFENCIFNNCGQSETIHNIRNGFSACVRPSLAADKNLKNRSVRLLFKGCRFSNDGGIPVMTCYGGGTYYEYINCSWEGNILGYSETSTLPEVLGHCIEHVFYNCDDPVSRYSGFNTIRRLYSCFNVKNLFEDLAEAHNCDCIWSYSDVYNRYSEQLMPNKKVVIDSCRFRAGHDDRPRVLIHNPRSILFSNCSFDFNIGEMNASYKGYLVELKNKTGKVNVSFSNCQFNSSLQRLLDASTVILDIDSCINTTGSRITTRNMEQLNKAHASWRGLFGR